MGDKCYIIEQIAENGDTTMIGQGVYTLAEVSNLTQVHPSTVRTWFKAAQMALVSGTFFYQTINLLAVTMQSVFLT